MADLSIELGAKIGAASKALNIPVPEIMKMINGVDRSAWLKKGINLDVNQAADVVIQRLRKVYALNQDMPADIDDLLTIPNRDVQWGEEGNQDALQNFGGLDKNGRIKNQELAREEREKVKDARDPNVFLRRKLVGKDDRGRKKYGMEEVFVPEGQALPDEFRDAAILRDFGLREDRPQIGPVKYLPKVQRGKERFLRVGNQEVRRIKDLGDRTQIVPFREEVAPVQQVMEEARKRVEAAGPENIPGAYDIIGQLEDNVRGNRAAEASLVRELVARDSRDVNLDIVERNNWEAQYDARRLMLLNGQNNVNFQRMGELESLGNVKDASNASVTNMISGRDYNIPDNQALPIELAKGFNGNLSENGPMAGVLNKQQQWLALNMPDNRDNGLINDYPQVAIGEQLNAVNKGLLKLNFGGQGIDPGLANVRGINGLQRAVDAVLELGAAKGEGFFRLEDGKNIPVSDPGINEVLQKMGMNDNRKRDLAGALFALQAAGGKGANMLQDKRIFGGMQLNNGMPVARAGRAKIEGKEVAGQLQALDGRRADPPLNVQELGQARMPFIGGVQGESIPRAQFLRGKAVNMSPEQRIAAFGPKNAEIANRLERERNILFGMPKGAVDPANPPTGSVDSFAEQLRGQDADIAKLAELRNQEANAREVNEAFERMGMPLEGKGQMLLGGQIVNDPEPRPERNRVPDEVANNPQLENQRNNARDVIGQPVPDRFADKIRAARAQFSPGSQKATSAAVNPVSMTSPEMGGGSGIPPQPPAAAMASPSPEPEKYQRMGYKFRPDGASRGDRRRREVIRRLERGRTQRRTGAAVGGALAGMVGLDALIGGERDRREEEVYQ